VIVNVTSIGARDVGFVTAHACLGAPPLAASLNYVAGVNRANELIVPLDATGSFCLFTSSATHLAADISGYLPADSNLTGITPSRFKDTRSTGVTIDGEAQRDGKQAAGTQTRLQITGRGGVPSNANAVGLTVTAVQPDQSGFLTIHPCSSPPNTASLNYVPRVNGGNDIVARLDPTGGVCIYTSSTTHITVDVTSFTENAG
jgi:hypothetical protein